MTDERMSMAIWGWGLILAVASWGCPENGTGGGDVGGDTPAPDTAATDTRPDVGDTEREDGRPSTDGDAAAGDTAGGETADSTADGGNGCDPADWRVEEDAEATLVAARAPSAPTVDGDVSEDVYAAAPPLEIEAPESAGDNRMTVRSAWTESDLYVAVEVSDASVETTSSEYPPEQDGIELFFDTLLDRASSMRRDDYQVAISADGDVMVKDGSGKISLEPDLETATDDGGGYRIEMAVAWEEIDVAPEQGVRAGLQLGMLVGNNDLDGGDRQTWAWDGVEPWKQPDQWGYLRLGGATCEEPVTIHSQEPESSACPWAPEWVQIDQPVCRDDADTIIASKENLRSKIEGASSGEVVYIDETAEWDVTGTTGIDIAPGVTVSGGRGCDCARGALLYVTQRKHSYVFESASDDVRFTGIRLRGAVHDRTTLFDHGGDTYSHNGNAAKFSGDGVEIDNNKLFGWTARNLSVTGQNVRVHHNVLTRSLMEGLGYGVSVTGGADVLIDYNYFEYNRHAIAANGDTSYEAAHNVVGPNMTTHHFFDMHGGGKAMRFHHNTFRTTSSSAIVVRGTPSEGVWIGKNWFYHTEELECDGEYEKAWHIGGGCTNVHVSDDNHFGTNPPSSCDVGGPRSGCP